MRDSLRPPAFFMFMFGWLAHDFVFSGDLLTGILLGVYVAIFLVYIGVWIANR